MPDLVEKAKIFSQKYHSGQLYGDGNDYFSAHIEPVVAKALELAEPLGLDLSMVAVLAYLHDVLEDCDQATTQIIENAFGNEVLEGVLLLSNRVASTPSFRKTWDEYFAQIGTARPEIKIVKIADRLVNVEATPRHLDPDKKAKLTQSYIKQLDYYTTYNIFPELA